MSTVVIEAMLKASRTCCARAGFRRCYIQKGWLIIVLATLSVPLPVLAQDTPAAHSQKQTPPTQRGAKPAAISLQAQRSLELNERGVTAIRAREFDRAEQLLQQALEVDSKNITAVFNLAGMYITNKKDAQAVSLLEKYTALFPKDAGLHARLGDAYFSSQNPKKAVEAYEKALQLDPTYPTIPARLGTLYTMSNKLDKARVMFEQAIKRNPKDIQSTRNLSSIYLALGKPKDSIAMAKRALQQAPSAEMYVTLGNAYQQIRDTENALNAFQRAKDLGYKDPALAKVIEDLSKGVPSGNRA